MMSELEQQLLNRAYEHCKNTGEEYFSFVIPNGDMFIPLINATISLHESGYIENVSDNVYSDTFYTGTDLNDIYEDFRITFKLTEKRILSQRLHN